MIPRDNMLRVVKNKEGNVFLDISQKVDGRGAYVCKTNICIDKAIEKKSFARTLKCNVPMSVFEEIKGWMTND